MKLRDQVMDGDIYLGAEALMSFRDKEEGEKEFLGAILIADFMRSFMGGRK